MSIYCGNNIQHPSLTGGGSVLGTKYGCLKKGIGRGSRMIVDDTYGNYQPIDTRRVYCGSADILPAGYDTMGSLTQCLQKGIGMGKKIKYDKEGPTNFAVRYRRSIIISVCFITSVLGTAALLRAIKPEFIILDDDEIDNWKVATISLVTASLCTAIMLILLKYMRY